METETATTLTFFRAPGARVEHFVDPIRTTYLQTMCGQDAKAGARFVASERGQDAKVRPVCARCRSAYDARRSTLAHEGSAR